jgi:hypothetical protein
MDPGHCASPGCYFRSINYKASSRQMAALAELSVECSQSIKVKYLILNGDLPLDCVGLSKFGKKKVKTINRSFELAISLLYAKCTHSNDR